MASPDNRQALGGWVLLIVVFVLVADFIGWW
jgi:hypothetical protein